MESKGILKSVARDWKSRKLLLTFELEQDISGQLEALQEKTLSIAVKQYRSKRSLDANAYYWVLISRFAEAIETSKNWAHNLMLQRYGQALTVDGSVVYVPIPDTEKAEEVMMESSTFHLKPTSQVIVGKDGVTYRTYKMLRGSSDYDTREMAELIHGLVRECEGIGVETISEKEIERMLELYEKQHKKK